MDIRIPRGTKLAAFALIQTEQGTQSIRVGDVLIWRDMWKDDTSIGSIEISLHVLPMDGRITIREDK